MSQALNALRILVVEDDAGLSRVLKASLSKKGAIVTVANNGQEAWDLMRAQEYDLVMSDVQMPVMSGLELLAKVRARDPKKPHFVLVTGQAQVDDEQASALGAAALVQKPFRLAELVARLEKVLVSP